MTWQVEQAQDPPQAPIYLHISIDVEIKVTDIADRYS